MQVRRLGLQKSEYANSRALRGWCERNRNQYYIPEWLLKTWRMEVEDYYSGVA